MTLDSVWSTFVLLWLCISPKAAANEEDDR